MSRYSTPNYKSFKDGKVFAALIEGGMYFAGNNSTFATFENPMLKSQITAVTELQLPYGLYTVCRARNVEEARREMYQFSFPVRKYVPKMGVWLQLDLRNSKFINNILIDYYKKELITLGYKYKMGIICTRDMLKNIDWDTYQEDFLLWLVDHIDNVSEIDKLLDPQFFDTDGKG